MWNDRSNLLPRSLQNKAASVYTESIEKLRSVLSAMQTMSQKRERLEKGVRRQLEADIQRLKGEKGEEEEVQPRTELEGRIATLQADVAKVRDHLNAVTVATLHFMLLSGSTCSNYCY